MVTLKMTWVMVTRERLVTSSLQTVLEVVDSSILQVTLSTSTHTCSTAGDRWEGGESIPRVPGITHHMTGHISHGYCRSVAQASKKRTANTYKCETFN